MESNSCNKLAARYEKAAENGLVDVKFFLKNLDEALKEDVCREVEAVYEAFEGGSFAPLDFADSKRPARAKTVRACCLGSLAGRGMTLPVRMGVTP